MISKLLYDVKKYVITSKNTSQHQKVCRNVKKLTKYVMMSKVDPDIKKYVMTLKNTFIKSTTWRQNISSKKNDVIAWQKVCRNIKKCVMTGSPLWCQRYAMASRSMSRCQKVCKVRHDIMTSWWHIDTLPIVFYEILFIICIHFSLASKGQASGWTTDYDTIRYDMFIQQA